MGRRYVIVGNGPAGVTAAEAIRRHDSGAEVTIVGDEAVPFYSRPGLAYLLIGTIPEKQLFSRPDSEYARQRLRREVGLVQTIDPGAHRIALADGRRLAYDRLLLAIGARALRPDIPGVDLEGVVTLDNLEDARRILRLAKRARRACVVGGGITAIELAEGLAAQRVETHYLMRKERYWGTVLDPQESALIEARLAEERIRIHRRAELAAVVGRRGRVAAIELTSGDRLPCDLLALAIGTQPRLELARQAGLQTDRGLLTDATFCTSDPDIFAAGDVAEMEPERRSELLPLVERERAEEIEALLRHPEDTAGGIMTTEYLAVPDRLTATEVVDLLRWRADEVGTPYYVYITDDEGVLTGVLSLFNLLIARPEAPLVEFTNRSVVSVPLRATQDEVARAVAKYNLAAIPVVDEAGRLVGIVTADDALDKIIPTRWKKRLPRLYR